MTILDLESLLRVPHVEPDLGFDMSPDGEQIAFSWNPTGQWEIYRMPLDGSGEPKQVTTGSGGKFNPQWSPDGTCLAYALDLHGGELYDIYVYEFATDQHVNLTPETPDAIQPNYCWSPDGRWLALLSDRSGRFDTYIMPTTGNPSTTPYASSLRTALSTPFPDWEVQWSPDGDWLAVVAEAHGQDYWTFIVPAKGGEHRIIGDDSGPICAKDPSWSPDGTHLAFASDLHGSYDIGIYELATGQITWVTEGEGEKEQPTWSPDGVRLACVASNGPLTELLVLDLETASLTTHRVEVGVHHRPRFTSDGAHLTIVFDNPRHPCDLWLISLVDGCRRQVTHSLPVSFRRAAFAMPMTVHYPSLDGQSVPALLYRPEQAEGTVPAVVYIHGGPNWLTQVTWDPLVQHMVSRGWAVLAPNYRGSTGYGREWQLASRFDFGGCDTRDVVAGADFLAREGIADPARIAVTGRSWGGYLTMTSMTQHPDRWVGGSAVVPFLNWFTAHRNSREDLQHWDLENFGDPERNHDLYYERSPFFFLDRIAAPVQMICGAHDIRCPASESIQARDRLWELDKECELVLYPDEGHSFLKTENVVDAERRRAAFLAEKLENAGR